MTKFKIKSVIAILLLISALNSCMNLKSVNDYSSKSAKSIEHFEDINYSFEQHCIERCQFEAIRTFEIKRETECNCDAYKKADSVTLVIYRSIKAYFDGLTSISDNELTSYNVDALKKSLTEGDFGDIKIDKKEIDAYSEISNIVLKATTDIYRKNKIKKYIEIANPSIQVLLSKFQFILEKNLNGELNFKKEKIYAYYQEMKLRNTLTDYEKGKATLEYYQQLSEINHLQLKIEAFVKGVKVIADGHQHLYDNRNEISKKEMIEMMKGYAGNIKDIISEFNKLKK